MSKFLTVEFPDADTAPEKVYEFTLYQRQYQHDLMKIVFKDWDVSMDSVRPGTPIQATITGHLGEKKEHYGYVHHVVPVKSPGKNHIEVVAVGASFPMKQQSQAIYKNTTADEVVRKIGAKHGFAISAIPHPRIFDQIAHAGHTDWQLLVRLAKQVGYTLRAENTELYFEPILEDYKNYRDQAPVFTMRHASNPQGSDLYKFEPMIGDSIDWDGDMKSAAAISGVDRLAAVPVQHTKPKRAPKTKSKSQLEFFDRFDTHVVARDVQTAQYEAEAAEARQSFPYRGQAMVLGHTALRPNMPVYLAGVGKDHSGFWTVLGTEHHIIESELNVQKYTVTMEVGTDSLGQEAAWSNGVSGMPSGQTKRKIIQGVAQTKVKPKTALLKNNMKTKTQPKSLKGSFGKINNRVKPAPGPKNIIPSKWKTATPKLSAVKAPASTRSAAVVTRLAKKK